MHPTAMERLAAWGQYIHWADLQFMRYTSMPEGMSSADQIGIVSHWLASEYVVLEGWKKLGYTDTKIDKLLAAYPEHCDVLRRCRNAVYHFQTEMLDERIGRCLKDENEELQWSVVLHFEFQRFLLNYAYRFDGTRAEKEELAESIIAWIGWSPTNLRAVKAREIFKMCTEAESLIGDNASQSANELRALVVSTIDSIDKLDMEPLYHRLKRIQVMGAQDSQAPQCDA